MRSITHPQDDLRLATQRGVELRRIASEQRMLTQHRADRRAARMATIGTSIPTWRRRALAGTVAITIALSIGAVSSQVDASTASDNEQTVSSVRPGPHTLRMQ